MEPRFRVDDQQLTSVDLDPEPNYITTPIIVALSNGAFTALFLLLHHFWPISCFLFSFLVLALLLSLLLSQLLSLASIPALVLALTTFRLIP